MTTGVLGGTFDPPHIGHLRAAVEARELLHLDRVLLVVANVPWQKVGTRTITDAPRRLEMVRAAAGPFEGIEASDLELRRGGDSFTADTLRELRSLDPDEELVVLVGADVARSIASWRDPAALPDLARLAVLDRVTTADPTPARSATEGGSLGPVSSVEVAPGLHWAVERVPIPLLEVSSSEVRARVRSGRSIDLLVPEGVATVIDSHAIYRGGS